MTAPQTAGPALPPGGAGPRLLIGQDQIDRDRAYWLAVRTEGITGTDVATLLGLSAHMGPYSLYHAKLNGIETADKAVLRRGRRLETEIDDLLQDEYPWLLPRPAGLYGHAERGWMMATIDRWVMDTDAASALTIEQFREQRVLSDLTATMPAEYKTWATTDGWVPGADGNIPGAMPVQVRCQSIWNMTVAGAGRILVVVLWMTPWRIGTYEITADDPGVRRDLDVMLAGAVAFRQRLLDRDEPDVDDLPATTETLRRLHPDLADESVRVPIGLAERYWAGVAAERAVKARRRLVQNELRERMGPAARAHIVDPATGRRVTVCSRSIADTQVRAHDRHDDKLTPRDRWER
jgi:YqaJ-like viral recombinase domain